LSTARANIGHFFRVPTIATPLFFSIFEATPTAKLSVGVPLQQLQGVGSGRGRCNVNSAPALDGESHGQALQLRDRTSWARSRGSSGAKERKAQEKSKVKDDYEKFVEGLGDIQ
jgi:hypothetical protein